MMEEPHNEPSPHRNPFVLVKSNDLSDAQIQRFWVDFRHRADVSGPGFFSPISPMPTIIVGGKGSGKTHLMRYHSFSVQAIRFGSGGDWTELLANDGYVGIYTRAGGLQAERFQGKGITEEQWREVFSYYTELWYAQETVAILRELVNHLPDLRKREKAVAKGFVACFDDLPQTRRLDGFSGLADMLQRVQRKLDLDINEAAFKRRLRPRIRASRGSLIFGFPQVVAAEVPAMNEVLFSYYVDEYENFSILQQKYINTLVREHQAPSTLRIGARAYGMRTYETYSAQELLKEGSEFELLQLDSHFRSDRAAYKEFSRSLVRRRLEEHGITVSERTLDSLFDSSPSRRKLLSIGDNLFDGDRNYRNRPHFRRLRATLKGVLDKARIGRVVDNLHAPTSPLLEKAALYTFFQAWATDRDLVAAAVEIDRLKADFLSGNKQNALRARISHFGNDFVGQLLRDARQPPSFAGLTTFISISEGLPRALLTTLKHIFSWATFRGEWRDGAGRISVDTQRKGVLEASEWFLNDLRQGGNLGFEIQSAMRRLSELFRLNHLGDKPIECSLIAFSVDTEALNARAREVLQEAEMRSFLVRVPAGERDRNSTRIRDKYQLSKMLCPHYRLPITRRGTIRLDVATAEAIFDLRRDGDFARVVKEWDRRINAPFARARRRPAQPKGPVGRLI